MKNHCFRLVNSGWGMLGAFLFAFGMMSIPTWGEEVGNPPRTAPAEEPPAEVELEARPGDPVQGESDPRIVPTGIQPPTPPGAGVPSIGTSRPSFTDANTTVPQGSFQVESGATYTDYSGGTRSWTTPETLLRLGATKNTELRFTTPSYTYLRADHSGRLLNNFGDISAGLSHHFALPGKIDMAVIPILNIPTGADIASSNSLDPQLRVSIGHAVTSKLAIGGHLDTRWNTGRAATAKAVLNPTFITYYYPIPKLGFFVEYSGFYPTTGKTTQFVQTGALFVPTPRQQFDVRIAAGLNKVSPDFLVGFGYSFRVDGLFGASRAFSSFGSRSKR